MSATKDEIIAAQAQQIVEQQARVEELNAALSLWKVASDDAEECEFDELAHYAIPMPLFCDADGSATCRPATSTNSRSVQDAVLAAHDRELRAKTLEDAAEWFAYGFLVPKEERLCISTVYKELRRMAQDGE